MLITFVNFIRDESGATTTEYGLAGSVIVVGSFFALIEMGEAFNDMFITAGSAVGP